MARVPGVLDGITKCTDCDGSMVKAGVEYRCMCKMEPEELVAVGFIPCKNADGKIVFDSTALDQTAIWASQSVARFVDIDNTHLQSLGLDLYKIRQYQIKHSLLP